MVVRKDPSLTEAQIIEYSRKELTGYKVPHRVYFRESLPKSNVGKILRRELRDELMKGKDAANAPGESQPGLSQPGQPQPGQPQSGPPEPEKPG